jgi:hypothetical protein
MFQDFLGTKSSGHCSHTMYGFQEFTGHHLALNCKSAGFMAVGFSGEFGTFIFDIVLFASSHNFWILGIVIQI